MQNDHSGVSLAHRNTRKRETAAEGHRSLTLRQIEVLRLFAEGVTTKEIGEKLGLKKRTIFHHKYRIMKLLGITRSAELILYAVRIGLVSDQ